MDGARQPDHERGGSAASGEAVRSRASDEVLVTLLMCDLVDSTRLSTKLTPGELRDVLMSYYTLCLEVSGAHAGQVIRYIGDGVACVFTHDAPAGNGARNALEAALALHPLIHAIRPRSGRHALDALVLRSALATGWGVRADFPQGSGARQELLFGQIPFLTDRMKGLAALDQIVVCDTTAALVSGSRVLHCLGRRALRGFPAMQASRQLRRAIRDRACTRGATLRDIRRAGARPSPRARARRPWARVHGNRIRRAARASHLAAPAHRARGRPARRRPRLRPRATRQSAGRRACNQRARPVPCGVWTVPDAGCQRPARGCARSTVCVAGTRASGAAVVRARAPRAACARWLAGVRASPCAVRTSSGPMTQIRIRARAFTVPDHLACSGADRARIRGAAPRERGPIQHACSSIRRRFSPCGRASKIRKISPRHPAPS